MYDATIIGAGIVGCSLAYGLGKYQIKAVLIGEESDVSVGATKASGAIIHGGYDPLPGSKMTRYNVTGNAYIKELCGKSDIPCKQIGTLIIVFSEVDKRTLEELKNYGIQNGVKDMEIQDKGRLHREEPYVSQEARAALYSLNVGIVDPWELALALAEIAVEDGIEVRPNMGVKDIERTDVGYSIETNQGVINVVCVCNVAGVFADEINEMVNDATFKIEPNKGEYYLLGKSRGNLVNRAISQCLNENGKGVLVAPTVHGNLIVGSDSQSTSRRDVSTTAKGLSYVRNTTLKSIPDINFRESIHNFIGARARVKEDDFFVYEDPGNRLSYSIVGMASPDLLSAPATALGVIEMMGESGLSLTKKEACMDTRSVVWFREVNHEERTVLIKEHPEYGKITRRCETVTGGEVIGAAHRLIPAVSIDVVKCCCDTEAGRCRGGFCNPRVREIIAGELKKSLKDVPLDREGIALITGETKAAGGEQE